MPYLYLRVGNMETWVKGLEKDQRGEGVMLGYLSSHLEYRDLETLPNKQRRNGQRMVGEYIRRRLYPKGQGGRTPGVKGKRDYG